MFEQRIGQCAARSFAQTEVEVQEGFRFEVTQEMLMSFLLREMTEDRILPTQRGSVAAEDRKLPTQ